MPTGLDQWGRCGTVFHADETVTMGALKLALFVVAIAFLLGTGFSPFLYFRF